MSDSFTEVTTKSWGSRLGKSIKGVLFGLVLIVGSCVFLFWNEGRAVQTQRSLTEGASLVVSADPARVDPANDGKLVHLSGDLKPARRWPIPTSRCRRRRCGWCARSDVSVERESKSETRENLGGWEETVTAYEYHRVWSETRNEFEPVQAAGRPCQSADGVSRRVLYVARRDARRLPPGAT